MSVLIGLCALVLIVAYPLMKRITYWPQAFLGITFNIGILIGWAAVTGGIETPALILYAAGICWTIGYDTIYAHQDIEDDVKIGVKSTAILFGNHSKKIVTGFYAVMFALMAFLAMSILSGAALLAAAIYTWSMLKNWDPSDQASSLTAFKRNITLGWIILVAFALI